MAYTIGTMTEEEKQTILTFVTARPGFTVGGPGVSVYSEAGEFVGGFFFINTTTNQVGGIFKESVVNLGVWIPLWPQIVAALCEHNIIFCLEIGDPSIKSIAERSGWWNREEMGSEVVRYTYSRDYTLDMLRNWLVNDPNFVPRFRPIRETIEVTSTSTTVTRQFQL